jgi:hypothetical protein
VVLVCRIVQETREHEQDRDFLDTQNGDFSRTLHIVRELLGNMVVAAALHLPRGVVSVQHDSLRSCDRSLGTYVHRFAGSVHCNWKAIQGLIYY